jgi:tetratricopeptide (TPR) repeat protein
MNGRQLFFIFLVSIVSFYLGRVSINPGNSIKSNRIGSKVSPSIKGTSDVDKKGNHQNHNIKASKLLKTTKLLEKKKLPSKKIIPKYREILKLEPDNINAIYRLAYHLKKDNQDNNESIELYKKCVELDPSHEDCNFYLSLYAAYELPAEEAYEVMSRCIDHMPKEPSCHYYLAKLNHREGRYKESIEYYLDQLSEYREIGRTSVATTKEINFNLAMSYGEIGNRDAYIKHLKISCEMGFKDGCEEIEKDRKKTAVKL